MQRMPWLLTFALASLACAGIWSLAARDDRRTVLGAARVQLAATARLLEQHADRALEAGDRALRIAVQAAGDPRTLHEGDRGPALHAVLRSLVDDSPQLGSAWLMDAEGVTLVENWSYPPRTVGAFAQRPYFRAHQQGEQGLHVGTIGIGTQMGQARFTLSRPLRDEQGRFAGVAVAGVYSAYFADVYAESGLGPATRFALFRADGAPLAIWPPPPPEALQMPVALDGPLPPRGAGEVRETAAGTLLAVRGLESYPVALAVTQPLDEILGEWRRRTWRSGAVLAAVIVALAVLTIFGLRGARQERTLLHALRAERGLLERRVAARTAALAESEARFRDMADNAPVMVWVTGPDGTCTFLSRSWYEFTGQTPETGLGMGWLDAVHPEDRERAAEIFDAAQAAQGPFQIEYRVRRADGLWRWAIDAAAPRFDADGQFLGHVGSVIDITERRAAEDRQALMARELDHRAKNALTVVQAALRLTPRQDVASYARAVEGRVAALARAHTVLAEGQWHGATLDAVVAAELATFMVETPHAVPRAVLDGPPLLLTPGAVQALSMTLHELATNATKYGALSRPEGRVRVSWSTDGAPGVLLLCWTETGGPPLETPPARRGFGSRVIEATVAGQLGGTVEQDWDAAGLVCRIALPLDRVVADAGTVPAADVPAGMLPLAAQ